MLDATLDLTLRAFRLDARVAVEAGEVVAVLGPNGSGKTTALRLLAGLLAVGQGSVAIDGVVVDDPAQGIFVAPEHRRASVVFQDYLLFPHLDARDNVAFGLRSHGVPKGVARHRADQLLDGFGLLDRATAKPKQLSGGQAQRVALARALAPDPRLLLLDEPLAALDAGTRATVRRDLRRHLDGFTGATVLVTHDPLDAIALASRVVILEGGQVSQSGGIAEITQRPTSRYVADLIGLNLFRGVAHATAVAIDGSTATITVADAASGPVHVLIHPNAVALHTVHPMGSPRNQWPVRVVGFDLLGDRVRVRLAGAIDLVAEITPAAVAELDLHEGQDVWAAVKATEVETYPV